MIWISIILGIIQAVPTLIKVLQAIMDLMHHHPMKALHENTFLGILSAWNVHKDPTKVEAELTSLLTKLKGV